MGRSKTATWVVGTVLVCALLTVAAWFLAISPRFESAALTNADAEGVEQQNEILAARVATLAEQYERIDEFRAELAGLRVQVPADTEMSDYLRELDSLAAAHTVTLVSAIPGVATELVPDPATVDAGLGTPPAPPAPEPTVSEGAADDGAADAAVEAAPVVPGSKAVTLPITLTLIGAYENVNAYVDALQQSDGRLSLVAGLSVIGQDQNDAGSGRPATQVGDVEVTVTGYLYATPLSDVPAGPSVDQDGEDVAPPPLPTPAPGRNPLVPIG